MANGIESRPVEYVRPPRAMKYQEQSRTRNFHAVTMRNEPRNMKPPCSLCHGFDHGGWFCKQFYEKGVDDRWKIAKERKLCFRCLASDHRGKDCTKARKCGIDGCTRIITAFFMEVKFCQKLNRWPRCAMQTTGDVQSFHRRGRPRWSWPAVIPKRRLSPIRYKPSLCGWRLTVEK